MKEGDVESNYAHFCLQKLKKFPHEFLELPFKEKAFVIASIQIRIEDEKEEAKKIKSKAKK
ncbi:MAG: hypothetical protein HFJ26_08525 [Clostridia bacterium]|nr:hypothetical protein [Clostridia bacterium]